MSFVMQDRVLLNLFPPLAVKGVKQDRCMLNFLTTSGSEGHYSKQDRVTVTLR